jgi:hypothetical protein
MMRIFKTVGKTLAMVALAMMLAAPAMAGNGHGSLSGEDNGDRTQDQIQDGSCLDAVGVNSVLLLLAGNGNGNGGEDSNGTGPGDDAGDGVCDNA